MNRGSNGQDMMHGSIFILLQRFVDSTHEDGAWAKIIDSLGIEETYQINGMYPTDDLFAIVHQVSDQTKISVYDLMEQYGEFIVPDLLSMYQPYLQPEWRTYEMLLNTEEKMHGAVRREDSRTAPPRLLVTRQSENRLIIDYSSKRRMAGVAIGIIRGIARHYNETDTVHITRLSQPDAEVVQILVDFDR